MSRLDLETPGVSPDLTGARDGVKRLCPKGGKVMVVTPGDFPKEGALKDKGSLFFELYAYAHLKDKPEDRQAMIYLAHCYKDAAGGWVADLKLLNSWDGMTVKDCKVSKMISDTGELQFFVESPTYDVMVAAGASLFKLPINNVPLYS